MFQDELDKVEQPALDQLIKFGWRYLPGSALAPNAVGAVPGAQLSPGYLSAEGSSSERAYYRDVLLINRLEAALRKLNPWISEENLRKVMREITHPNYAGLMEYNHAIYQMMVNYLSVEQDLGKGRKGQTVKIID